MKINARFIASFVAEAKKNDFTMPWTRGARRALMIARRSEATEPRNLRTA